MSEPFVSVVIPAYNEAARLAPTLLSVTGYFASRDVPYEILVVDDGSSDATQAVARSVPGPIRVIGLERNRGKGAAVRAGVRESLGRQVLFTDADLSTPIDEWERLRRKLEQGCDIVIGSRALGESRIEVPQPWYRERMGKTFNWILRRVLPLELGDTQCGFKLFEADVAKELFRRARIDGFAFDAEVLFLAERFGYRIGELPVRWLDSLPSRVHPFLHSVQMLKDLARIRWLSATGAYGSRRGRSEDTPETAPQ